MAIYKSSQNYQNLVKKHHPQQSKIKNFMWAYLFGGGICLLGQLINNSYIHFFNIASDKANTLTTITLIFIGGLLTGFGVYDELAQIAGAGTIVPITGFANAVVSPALEHRQEGYILGTGAQVYSIVGPVLTYGMLTAMLIGVFKLLL